MYYTYIARCSDNSLYTGITNNISDREKRHNAGTGSSYTAARRPIHIVYSKSFPTRSEAARREVQIRGWTRNKKERLIRSLHPTKQYPLSTSST
jgi:putative endonuclease